MKDVRMPYWKADKVGFGKMMELAEHIRAGSIEPALLHLVYLRVSQINGCGYCVDVHWKDAVKAGVEPRVLNGLVIWRATPFFTPRQQAALEWAEAVTRLEHQDVPATLFNALKSHFSEAEIMTLTLAVTNINSFNRIAIAFGRHADA